MKSDVAIIGGGFSGVATAYHLLQASLELNKPISIILFEPDQKIGAGIAYKTNLPQHILNVPASKMTLDDRQPMSFVTWLESRDEKYLAHDFVPRRLFQLYLTDSLKQIQEQSQHLSSFKIENSPILEIDRNQNGVFVLTSPNKKQYCSQSLILATGNSQTNFQEPLQPLLLQSPWDEQAINAAAKAKKIGLIGSGLSAVDAILGLESHGFSGQYELISRHGLLPLPHPPAEKLDSKQAEQLVQNITQHKSIRKMLKELRAGTEKGIFWWNIIEGLRSETQSIWKGLPLAEQNIFLRHLRAYWDVHRHRVPLESLRTIKKLENDRRLIRVRAQVGQAFKTSQGIQLEIRSSHPYAQQLGPYELIFDCRGLWNNLENCNNPLISSIIDRKLGSYDQLKRGLKTNQQGLLLNQENQPISGFFTLGALRRGELWESVAVREIRQQACLIAQEILKDDSHSREKDAKCAELLD